MNIRQEYKHQSNCLGGGPWIRLDNRSNTHSLVSVILVNGAIGWTPLFGGDDVLDPCLEDNLLLGNVLVLCGSP